MSGLGYIDRDGRVALSLLPLRVVHSRIDGEVWVYWRTGRFQSSGFRLWPFRSASVEQHG